MPQRNVEIVRKWIDAFNRGGFDEETLRFLDPEVEWTTTSAYLEAGTYHGHEGVRLWLRRATAGWEGLELEPQDVIDAPEHVVVPLRVTARDRQTGAPGTLTFTLLLELQSGLIVRARNYANEAEAFEAAGLSR